MRRHYLYRAYKARYRDQKAKLAASLAAVRPGDTVMDAGANNGAYLYWLKSVVPANGKVFAFEPQPKPASYLPKVCSTMA